VLSPLAREEMVNGNLTDGDDEILESLVKTATKAPATRTTPRERKRTRHADRKSCKFSYVTHLYRTLGLVLRQELINSFDPGWQACMPHIFEKGGKFLEVLMKSGLLNS